MKRILLVSAFSLLSQFTYSQFYVPFRLYNYDLKLVNPAFAGLKNEQNYQVQYSGSSRSTDNFYYTAFTAFSTPLPLINSGIGAFLSDNKVGSYETVSASLLYNYQLKLGENKRLSLGTQVTYGHTNIDYTDLKLKKDIPGETTNRSAIDFGIAYDAGNFSAGFSTLNLIQSNTDQTTGIGRYENFFSSYKIDFTPNIILTPSILLSTNFGSNSFVDVNGILQLKKVFLLGVGLRLSDNQPRAVYNAGVFIAKRVQLICIAYSGENHVYNDPHNNLEVMLRVVIKKSQTL